MVLLGGLDSSDSLMKGIVTYGYPAESQTTGPQTSHQLTISWLFLKKRAINVATKHSLEAEKMAPPTQSEMSPTAGYFVIPMYGWI